MTSHLQKSRAVIFGCAAHVLTADEVAFFASEQPWGFILFARNCDTPSQIKALCEQLRQSVGRADAPILIDQEGGRVARLRPPLAPTRPPMKSFGDLLALDPAAAARATRLGARLIAADLHALGINVNCVPMVDVRQDDAHDIVGDRSFGTDPEMVTALGAEVIAGCLEGGVLPIIKHIPGHGRALVDSHHDLPRVNAAKEDLRKIDFLPFKKLANAPIKAPMAMSAHVIYEAYDPDHCATQSSIIIQDVIRGEIGFDGLLMTDDLSMKALGGSFEGRSEKALKAGCDMLLHCNGDMTQMVDVARAAPILSGDARRRADAALAMLKPVAGFDQQAEEKNFAKLMKPVMGRA
ncbi:MAG: beta-N-acetylhexosaminidase [Parvularculaceae bacterium]